MHLKKILLIGAAGLALAACKNTYVDFQDENGAPMAKPAGYGQTTWTDEDDFIDASCPSGFSKSVTEDDKNRTITCRKLPEEQKSACPEGQVYESADMLNLRYARAWEYHNSIDKDSTSENYPALHVLQAQATALASGPQVKPTAFDLANSPYHPAHVKEALEDATDRFGLESIYTSGGCVEAPQPSQDTRVPQSQADVTRPGQQTISRTPSQPSPVKATNATTTPGGATPTTATPVQSATSAPATTLPNASVPPPVGTTAGATSVATPATGTGVGAGVGVGTGSAAASSGGLNAANAIVGAAAGGVIGGVAAKMITESKDDDRPASN
ncbi:hypothetical protein [Sphingomicrobium arenosum]|uniref:hypothetical protein n=1 Tax=Sphingomicrobium arenosum TaxID=2233861 RepID=UPI002240C16E|nr:hypothetical protein [Sphingomicrobium arenosum]